MTSESTPLPRAQDHAVLRRLLLRLTALHKLLAALVIVIVAAIWYRLLNRLLAFGDAIDYGALRVLGTETTALLQQYNPFFWWAVVILCTIIIAYLVYLFIHSTGRRMRLRAVDEQSVAELSKTLSAPALDVLLWTWNDRSEPLRIQDLERTRDELRAHRAAKIQQAARQLAMLQAARGDR
jgi:hypothetical protein